MSVNIGPSYRSFSSYTTWLSCGKKWQLARLYGVPEVPAWYLVGGNAVHRVTEEYDLALLAGEGEGFDFEVRFHQAFLDLTNEQIEKTGVQPHKWRSGGRASKQWPHKENAEWWTFNGPPMCQNYAKWRSDNPELQWWWAPGDVPAIELELKPNFGSVAVRMFIDRVVVDANGELGVVDIKSGARTPDTNLQLGIYATGMEQMFGVRPTWGAYWSARKGELTVPVPLDLYSYEQLTEELELFERAVGQEIFLPNRGSHCVSCGVAAACPAIGGPEAHKYMKG